jgi:predicted nucleic acid-binding protein
VFEVLAVLRRLAQHNARLADRAGMAVDDLAELPVVLYPTMAFRARAWELRRNVSVAAPLFVALAEALAEPLVKKERALAAAVGRHTGVAVVEVGR